MSSPPCGGDRSGARVAPTASSPSHGDNRYVSDVIGLPVILEAALTVAGTTVSAFIARLTKGSIWQDQAIRSANREIVIQAYLAPEGLRCIVQIGRHSWYHHPGDFLDVFGVDMPDAETDAPLSGIVGNDLLDRLPVRVTEVGLLQRREPHLGVRLRLDVPCVRHAISGLDPSV